MGHDSEKQPPKNGKNETTYLLDGKWVCDDHFTTEIYVIRGTSPQSSECRVENEKCDRRMCVCACVGLNKLVKTYKRQDGGMLSLEPCVFHERQYWRLKAIHYESAYIVGANGLIRRLFECLLVAWDFIDDGGDASARVRLIKHMLCVMFTHLARTRSMRFLKSFLSSSRCAIVLDDDDECMQMRHAGRCDGGILSMWRFHLLLADSLSRAHRPRARRTESYWGENLRDGAPAHTRMDTMAHEQTNTEILQTFSFDDNQYSNGNESWGDRHGIAGATRTALRRAPSELLIDQVRPWHQILLRSKRADCVRTGECCVVSIRRLNALDFLLLFQSEAPPSPKHESHFSVGCCVLWSADRLSRVPSACLVRVSEQKILILQKTFELHHHRSIWFLSFH